MAERLGDFVLAAWRAGMSLARPMVPLALSSRTARGKEDGARTAERYGKASRKRPEGRLIWVHGASVGETNAALPLIGRLTRAGFPVLYTTTTLTGAAIAAKRLPEGAFHQFVPIDVPAFVDRFLDHWRPYFVIFMESELWPTVIDRLERAVVPLVVVNARMSDRSFRRWQGFGRIAAKAVFARIGLVLARSEEDGRRFRALGAEKVTVTGNLKFDTPPLSADPGEVVRLKATIGGRPAWLAASTHEGEEAQVAAAHRAIAARSPGLLTVIAPRHPERGEGIAAMLRGDGLSVARRGAGEAIAPDTEIYLADTLGELGLFYRAIPIAFVGGSLIERGGQNPIEAVQLGAAVLHGPHVANFIEVFAAIDAAVPGSCVADAAGLADAVAALLANPDATARSASDAAAALKPSSGALDATVAALQPYLSGKYYAP